jgi:hypothetical protein
VCTDVNLLLSRTGRAILAVIIPVVADSHGSTYRVDRSSSTRKTQRRFHGARRYDRNRACARSNVRDGTSDVRGPRERVSEQRATNEQAGASPEKNTTATHTHAPECVTAHM